MSPRPSNCWPRRSTKRTARSTVQRSKAATARRWRSPGPSKIARIALCARRSMATTLPSPPKIGMVSLGCPKNLVDSERILTKLRSDGYAMSADYAGADVVLVNTCGFLDSAQEQSFEAIRQASAEKGRVIVTGCMAKEAELIRERFPDVLAVTGAHQYE